MKLRTFSCLALGISLLASFPLSAADDLPLVTPKVKTVAAFKNGLGFVVKTGETPLKDGWAYMDSLPNAALGSLWIGTTNKAATVTDVITCKQKVIETFEAISIPEILSANVGKHVALTYVIGTLPTRVEGTLLSAPVDRPAEESHQPTPAPTPTPYGYYGAPAAPPVRNPASDPVKFPLRSEIVLLRSQTPGHTTVHSINKSTIQSVELLDDPVLTAKIEKELPRVKLHVSGNPRSAEITMVYLEKGINWSPSYRINIANEKTADISLDAVLANDVEDLDNAEVSFVVGYPNFKFVDLTTPLSTEQTVAEFIQALTTSQNSYFNRFQGITSNVMSQSIMSNSAQYAPQAASVRSSSDPTTPGERSHDLYFYKKTGVTLKKGDRARYEILTASVPYEHVYQWEVPDSMYVDIWGYRRENERRDIEEQVWHTIRLQNTTQQPWTTAPAFVVNGMLPVSQDVLNYTPTGAKNPVKLTLATDVRGEQTQTEAKREGIEMYGYHFICTTVDGKLKVTNLKSTEIKVVVKKPIVGEVLAAPDGTVTKPAKLICAINQTPEIEWNFSLPAGKTKELTYQYRVLFH